MSDLAAYLEAKNVQTQAWIDAGPDRYATMHQTDVLSMHELAQEGIYTPEQYEHSENQNTYSDFYKDVHGFRPRHVPFMDWDVATMQREIDSLCAESVVVAAEDAARQARGVAAFEATLVNIMEIGNVDRETSIRWIRDADEDQRGDDNYFEYSNNLPYGYLTGNARPEMV